jgi:hypothetical protein
MKPILMIGTQRSGSNLLRLMLNQLSEIASPHPPHILQRMFPLLDHYGDLSQPANFEQLVDDVCKLVELNPVPWEGVTLDRADVLRRCREPSLVAVFGAVYDICGEAQGANMWCCKSLANVNYGPEMEDYFDQAKYIYLFRDGRDVAVSFSKAVVGEKHYYHIAKEWSAAQEKALALRESVPHERFFMLSYEDLTTDTEASARRLCDFLETDYTDAMLEFHRAEEAKRAADASTLWSNVTQPVMKHNSQKFLREATPEQITAFENVAGHVLDALGYERFYVKSGEERSYTPEEIAAFDAENARLKQAMRDTMDQDDLERRDRQANLLKQIQASRAA